MEKPSDSSSYNQKVLYAISSLKDKHGSSYKKIETFLSSEYPELEIKHNFVMKALNKAVQEGTLIQDGYSFRFTNKQPKKSNTKNKRVSKTKSEKEELWTITVTWVGYKQRDFATHYIPVEKLKKKNPDLYKLLSKSALFDSEDLDKLPDYDGNIEEMLEKLDVIDKTKTDNYNFKISLSKLIVHEI